MLKFENITQYIKNLNRPIDDFAFSLFRFTFYSIILIFYKYSGSMGSVDPNLPSLKAFFDPISFYKFMDYDWLFLFNPKRIMTIWRISLLLAALGIFFPLSSFLSFFIACLVGGIPFNFGKINHVNHMAIVTLGILAFSYYPGRLSLDSFIFKKMKRFYNPLLTTQWPILTIKIYMVLVYFMSGIQKLRHGGLEWIFSDNMATIILTRPTMTPLGLWIAQFQYIPIVLAFFTVLFQLSAPISLFSRKYALVCMTSLFFMHIGTYLLLGNHGFFFPYNLCFLAWLPWEKISSKIKEICSKRTFTYLGRFLKDQ